MISKSPETTPETNNAQEKRKKRRATATIKKSILKAAYEEFKSCGFRDAKIAAIAASANVTEAQIYRYFPSKASLFQESIFDPLESHFKDYYDKYVKHVDKQHPILNPDSNSIINVQKEYMKNLQVLFQENEVALRSLVADSGELTHNTSGALYLEGLQNYFDHVAEIMADRLGTTASKEIHLNIRIGFAALLAAQLFKPWLLPASLGTDEEIREAAVDFATKGLVQP